LFNARKYLTELYRSCVRSLDDLTDDQREAVEFMHGNPASALYCDVGFGKTVATLTVLSRLIVDGYAGKILIIAPIRVATRVWPFEPRLWRHLAWMRMTVLRIEDGDPRLRGYSGKERTQEKHRLRRELLDSADQIHVIDFQAVDWLVAECAKRRSWPYKVVVFDESSRLRDHNSVIFKALKRVRPHISRFHELTATPASQTYMHLFSQIWMMDRGERFGNHITPFREKYFNYNLYAHSWKIRYGADREIERKIADICLVKRRTKDFVVRTRQVTLSSDLMRQYAEFERECILELADKAIDGVNAAVLCSKLLQFASGFVYDQNRTAYPIHNEKIEELRSLVDETLDQPVMVAYWFRESLDSLRRAFPDAVVMDREGRMEESWNNREHKLMLVHPQSVGHGMNLQHGGHHLVIFDLWYSLELFTQLIGRLDRPGQTDQVMVHLFCAQGTIDELVAGNLQHLRNVEDEMFRRLRSRVQDVLSGAAGGGGPGQPVQILRRGAAGIEAADTVGAAA
jgi:SNF2 family DNA or RNA helicase